VDDDGQVVVAGVELLLMLDHRQPELVQDQHLLRQVQLGGQARQLAHHRC